MTMRKGAIRDRMARFAAYEEGNGVKALRPWRRLATPCCAVAP